MSHKFIQPLGIGFALLCFFIAGFLLHQSGLPERAEFTGIMIDAEHFAPEVNQQAPPLFLSRFRENRAITLTEYEGQFLILNFWATWCIPCRVESQVFNELLAKYPEVAIVAVNTGDSDQDVSRWVEELRPAYTIGLDPYGAVTSLYAVRGLPTTFVISPEGIIIEILYGPVILPQLEQFIRT